QRPKSLRLLAEKRQRSKRKELPKRVLELGTAELTSLAPRPGTGAESRWPSMIRSFSLFFLSMPFLFGLLRAAATGNDFRYLWVAAASLIGAGAFTAAAGGRR